MITDDEVMRLFERADPARVDHVAVRIDAAGYLDALQTRSSNVIVIETTPAPTGPTRRPWPIITAAVAAMVLIVVGALALAMREDTTEPVIEPPTLPPKKTAQNFLSDTFVGFDAERAMTYLADGADISELINSARAQDVHGPEEGLRLYISLLQAQGFVARNLGDCFDRPGPTSGTNLRCFVRFYNLGSDEVASDLVVGFSGYFEIAVQKGKIVEASEHLKSELFLSRMWEPFASWVSTTYPQDAAIMYSDSTYTVERLTEESIRLWGQHTRDYVQEMEQLAETRTTQ